MAHEVWREFLSNDELTEYLEMRSEEVSQIIDILVEDRIGLAFIQPNMLAFRELKSPLIYLTDFASQEIVKNASRSFLNLGGKKNNEHIWAVFNQRPAIPIWFSIFYPDVLVWLGEEESKGINKEKILNYFCIDEKSTDVLAVNGKLKPKYLKNLIQNFKNITNNLPETRLQEPENDFYAATEFAKSKGVDKNVCLVIATNTAKYYAELVKNYSNRFPNESSVLATAGILDAQGYIFGLNQIEPQEIIEMANRSNLVSGDKLLDFILSLTVKLLKTDSPDIENEFIQNYVATEKLDEIKNKIQLVMNTYIGEVHFKANTDAFMQMSEFKSVRDVIGIR